jgi:tetratricopeptide (TPR) repeat protein
MKTPADGWNPEEREALRGLEHELEAVQERHRADPPIEMLRAARAGVLPDELQEEVARHLEEDAWSRALLDGVSDEPTSLDPDDEARLLDRIQRAAGEPPRRSRAWGWLARPAFAAAAACLILLAVVLGWRARLPRTEEAAPSGPVVATAPSPAPVFQLPLKAPAVKLSVAVLTWRGADEKNHLLADLKPGLDAFRQGDYTTANAELSKIAAVYPDSFDVRYYQGISRLLIDDVAGAIDSLTAARRTANSRFSPDVDWYLAVAYERAGRIDDARRQLTAACNAGGAHAADACAALPKIR